MKKAELTRKLQALRWSFVRQGGKHEIWGNGKGCETTVPRHKEINEYTARAIIRLAEENPG